MEDYNTATMPHRKYYEYEKWEVEDYEKRQRRPKSVLTRSCGQYLLQLPQLRRVLWCTAA